MHWQSAQTISLTGAHTPDLTLAIRTGQDIIKIHQDYFRPTELDTLLGDASKAKEQLGWAPKISFDKLVREMVEYDLDIANAEKKYKRFKTIAVSLSVINAKYHYKVK